MAAAHADITSRATSLITFSARGAPTAYMPTPAVRRRAFDKGQQAAGQEPSFL